MTEGVTLPFGVFARAEGSGENWPSHREGLSVPSRLEEGSQEPTTSEEEAIALRWGNYSWNVYILGPQKRRVTAKRTGTKGQRQHHRGL